MSHLPEPVPRNRDGGVRALRVYAAQQPAAILDDNLRRRDDAFDAPGRGDPNPAGRGYAAGNHATDGYHRRHDVGIYASMAPDPDAVLDHEDSALDSALDEERRGAVEIADDFIRAADGTDDCGDISIDGEAQIVGQRFSGLFGRETLSVRYRVRFHRTAHRGHGIAAILRTPES